MASDKKSTKVSEARETALAMLIGFAIASYFKVDVQMYGMLCLGLMGKTAGFMWGKSKEYEANTKVAVAQAGVGGNGTAPTP